MTNKKLLFSIAMLFCLGDVTLLYGRSSNENVASEPSLSLNPYYRKTSEFSFALGIVKLQDQATSPLIYSGGHFGVALRTAYQIGKSSSLNWKVDLGYAGLTNDPEQQTLPTNNFAHLIDLQLQLGFLQNLNFISGENLRFKLGTRADYWNAIGINMSHQNNALGFDAVASGSVSGQVDYNWRGKSLGGYPLTRKLVILSHLGLINANNRPGYNYNTSMPLISDVQADDIGRKWAINGQKLQTEVGFETRRIEGRATRIGYEFTGIISEGKFEPFGLVSHRIKYTIILNR